MADLFWLIILFPLVWPFAARYFFNSGITWAEMALNITLCTALAVGVWHIGKFSEISDVEVWSGEVVNKKKIRMMCEHSYQCMCVTVSCGKDCSTEICQTCYDHSFDNDWRVFTSMGKWTQFNIDRIDRQGLKEPPR